MRANRARTDLRLSNLDVEFRWRVSFPSQLAAGHSATSAHRSRIGPLSASFELTSMPGWAIVRSLLNDLRAQSALFESFVARELGTLNAIRLALDERQN